MKSLDKRLDTIQRKLQERNAPPPRLIQMLSTPEGDKYFFGGEPISADQLRATDVVIVLLEEPLPEHIVKQRLIREAHTAALDENARRDAARKCEAELGNARTKTT
jgi:hypothetical protein